MKIKTAVMTSSGTPSPTPRPAPRATGDTDDESLGIEVPDEIPDEVGTESPALTLLDPVMLGVDAAPEDIPFCAIVTFPATHI